MNRAAYILRDATGTSGLVTSARAAIEVLADHDIPHLIVGGLAVQEHGYPRMTIDVDIVGARCARSGGIFDREFDRAVLSRAKISGPG